MVMHLLSRYCKSKLFTFHIFSFSIWSIDRSRFHIMFRPRKKFNAGTILVQIIIIQILFYLSFYLLAKIIFFISDIKFSFLSILDPNDFHFHSKKSFQIVFIQVTSGFIIGIAFAILEGHHRKALDFISTYCSIHFIITILLYSFPKTLLWWISFFLTFTISFFVAKYLSLSRENRPININSLPSSLDRN